jgi:hypothetical protein
VYSGPARQRIPDAGFASGDTAITSGEKKTTGLTRITDSVRILFTPPARYAEVTPKHVVAAALYSVGAVVFVNMVLIWLGGIFGAKVWLHAWPMEIIAVGILLSALMAALAIPWMLIPAGIVLGNGLLFSFFALTGWWRLWTILWPLEPLLAGVCIVSPFWLIRQGKRAAWLARRIGIAMVGVAVVIFFFSVLFGIILP